MGLDLLPIASPDDFQAIKENFKRISDNVQSLQKLKEKDYLTTAPSTNDLNDKQMTLAEIGGTMYIYMRVGGNNYRVALNAV